MSMVDQPYPDFQPVDGCPGLWSWRGWTIADCGDVRYWLLTSAMREFGPFTTLSDAKAMVRRLLFLPKEGE